MWCVYSYLSVKLGLDSRKCVCVCVCEGEAESERENASKTFIYFIKKEETVVLSSP